MNPHSQLICFTGLSGGGKNFFTQQLFIPSQKLTTSTSRNTRKGEKHNIDYYFVLRKEFERMIKNNELIEYEEFDGNYYGLTKHEFESKQQNGDMYIILTAGGIKKYKELFPESIAIFLDVETDEAIENMRTRGDSEEDIKSRLAKFEQESKGKAYCDYIVTNKIGHSEETLQELMSIIKQKKEC